VIDGADHALLNAGLNGLSGLLCGAGWLAIRRRARASHRRLMLSATGVSAVFLVSYLVRVALSGTHRYPGAGAWKAIYLAVLISHMLLAVVTPPLILRAIWLATRDRVEEHRQVVRWAFPIWMYVSVTGVLVYLLLYHPPTAG
jgi:putative membrane protein